jgi:hypothetical protein
MAQLVAALPNAIQWPEDATLTLIRRRRLYQAMFASSRVREQGAYWGTISRDIARAHNFAPTLEQCRNKWNALKSGYENLARLIAGNPHRYPTRTPTMHDETFYDELSDEFWLTMCNCLLFN